jgi:hypothetical protein
MDLGYQCLPCRNNQHDYCVPVKRSIVQPLHCECMHGGTAASTPRKRVVKAAKRGAWK